MTVLERLNCIFFTFINIFQNSFNDDHVFIKMKYTYAYSYKMKGVRLKGLVLGNRTLYIME